MRASALSVSRTTAQISDGSTPFSTKTRKAPEIKRTTTIVVICPTNSIHDSSFLRLEDYAGPRVWVGAVSGNLPVLLDTRLNASQNMDIL